MTYSLDPAMPVTSSVRQVALSELDNAVSWLSEPDIHAGIHNARKCLKRLRSMLWMVKPGITGPLFDYLQGRLRDIGKELAPARDAQALIDTLDKLGGKSPKLLKGAALKEMRTLLENRREKFEANKADPVREAISALEALRPTLAKMTVYPDEFSTIAKGAKKTYRDTRNAYRKAYKKKTDEAFHDWRKQVQRHWRQLQLLTPCWPDALGARANHVHSLAQKLGDDHDLANLHALAIAPAMSFGGSADTASLAKRCRKDQKALRSEAKALGARLFADKPKTFKAGLQAHWRSAAKAAAAACEPTGTDDVDMDGHPSAGGVVEDSNIVLFGSGQDSETKAG